MIETLEQVEALLDRIRYTKALLCELTATKVETTVDSFYIRAVLEYENVIPGARFPTSRISNRITILPGTSEMKFFERVLELITKLEMHEILENFWVDDVRFHNPHVETDLYNNAQASLHEGSPILTGVDLG